MKRIVLAAMAVAITLSLSAQTAKHTEWRFSSRRTAKYNESKVYPAAVGKGEITFVGKKATTTQGVKKAYPTVEGARKGDYWLLTIPTKDIKTGTAIDLWLPFLTSPSEQPHNFVLEYRDGKRWCAAMPTERGGANCTSTISKTRPRYLWQTIRLENGISEGNIMVRLRHRDKSATCSSLYGGSNGNAPKVTILDERIPSDTTRVLFIGNSGTYYNLNPMIVKELAWYEGHYLDCATYLHGGYTIEQHLADNVANETIERGGYDYAFLLDHSMNVLRVGTTVDKNVAGYIGDMVAKIEQYSPKAKCFLTMRCARKGNFDPTKSRSSRDIAKLHPEYFGSYEAMQRALIDKTIAMAQDLGIGVSPWGIACEIVHRERPDIDLYAKDGAHPSYAASYLAAALTYLTIFHEPFKADTPARLDRETAAYLRNIAERVVLKR